MVRLPCVVPALLCVCAVLLQSTGAVAVEAVVETAPNPAQAPAAVPAAGSTSSTSSTSSNDDSSEAAITAADALASSGRHGEAIAALETWSNRHPRDQVARAHLLELRVAQKEADIRAVLNEQAGSKELILGDPDYEAARERADTDVRKRLAIVEYLLGQNRLNEAAQGCNGILRDYPKEPATLRLKFRILNTIVARERAELLKEKEYRHGEGVNDTIEDGIFPRDPARVKRHVFVFQEDIDDLERARVKDRLQEKITLNQDQAKVWDVMKTLFAVSGINYVVLDSAVGDETVSLHLVDDTVESALGAVAKLAKVRFSYTDGTVFVSSDADDGLVTEIIRLRSGLTNVEAEVKATSFSGDQSGQGGGNGGGGAFGANGGGGANGIPPGLPPQVQQALRNQQQGNRGGANGRGAGANGGANGQQNGGANGQANPNSTDLEKFLDKLPDIIVGWQETHKWHLDRKSNTLYLRANPWVISEVKRLLHALDYNNVQVLIESRFIEVSDEALRQLGVDWGAQDATGTKWKGGIGTPILPAATTGGAGAILSGLLQQNSFTLNATLKALETDKKLDTLAEPKILTLNNATGIIEIATNYTYIQNYTTQSYTTSSSSNTIGVTNNVSSVVATPEWGSTDVGYQLKITPSIARNADVITLKLQPKVKELIDEGRVPNGFEYQPSPSSGVIGKDIFQPRFSTRTLETVLHVENGHTVALGGLADEKQSFSTTGAPFISRIPVLGYLFKSEERSSKRRNLIILVTANLVDPSGGKVGEEIQHLRDTARILIPQDGVVGMDPTKPVMTEAANPAGPKTQVTGTATDSPRGTPLIKGRRP